MSLLYSNQTDMKIERDQLDYLPEPEKMGRFHRPYPFAEYIDDIHAALRVNNIVVSDEEYVIQKDAQRLFGMMVIESEARDFQLTLGVRGSHDQSIPRGIALGSNVLVCSNLCFSGELFTGKAKQTVHNGDRILDMIDAAVRTIPVAAYKQQQQFDAMKAADFMHPGDADSIMIEAFKRGALSGAQLGVAIKEYDKPSYAEHGHAGDMWRLFNAFTQAIKPRGQGVDMNGIVRKTQIISNIMNSHLSHVGKFIYNLED